MVWITSATCLLMEEEGWYIDEKNRDLNSEISKYKEPGYYFPFLFKMEAFG